MASADLLLLALWLSAVVPSARGCPQLCTCVDKYNRHFAECSNKHLTEVPDGLPPNASTLSLTTNKLAVIPLGSFDSVARVTSLWMAHNEIVTIEPGTLAALVRLRYFDISHNRIVDFPWEDLQNLTGLLLIKMDHNEMVHLPRDAFSGLKDLKTLRLNNNRFAAIAEGTFDDTASLSLLQIYNNPFACTCSLDWFRDWISTSTITFPEKNLITCESPEELRGREIGKLPESKCTGANVTVRTEPNVRDTAFREGAALVLTCEFTGNPKPLVVWSVRTESQKQELALPLTEDDSAESNEVSSPSRRPPLKVYSNGTLVVSHLRKDDGGNYSCSASNEFGRAEESVLVTVLASPKPAPKKHATTTPADTNAHLPTHQTDKTSLFDAARLPDLKRKDATDVAPTFPPTAESSSESPEDEDAARYPSRASKCGLTANTRYVSSHVFNGSLDDIKQYTFDFGVIALGVSETEATVRLNPLLMPRDRTANRAAIPATPDGLDGDSEEESDLAEKARSNGLYLCITTDRKHSAVQWSRIRDGVNTYRFSGLRPGTNYSLCLTYRGEDCEVQVLFATRRRVPNLLIIISVSICLLTVSTVPLLGATCFHLVYKYRSKTYKLILKAKDQYHMERNLAANFNIHAAHTESQRRINAGDGSQLDEEEEGETETESRDGEKEADTEESVMTESFSLSQCRANLDNCEVGSEYSDRLPLGAEAVNIISNYKYPNP